MRPNNNKSPPSGEGGSMTASTPPNNFQLCGQTVRLHKLFMPSVVQLRCAPKRTYCHFPPGAGISLAAVRGRRCQIATDPQSRAGNQLILPSLLSGVVMEGSVPHISSQLESNVVSFNISRVCVCFLNDSSYGDSEGQNQSTKSFIMQDFLHNIGRNNGTIH